MTSWGTSKPHSLGLHSSRGGSAAKPRLGFTLPPELHLPTLLTFSQKFNYWSQVRQNISVHKLTKIKIISLPSPAIQSNGFMIWMTSCLQKEWLLDTLVGRCSNFSHLRPTSCTASHGREDKSSRKVSPCPFPFPILVLNKEEILRNISAVTCAKPWHRLVRERVSVFFLIVYSGWSPSFHSPLQAQHPFDEDDAYLSLTWCLCPLLLWPDGILDKNQGDSLVLVVTIVFVEAKWVGCAKRLWREKIILLFII